MRTFAIAGTALMLLSQSAHAQTCSFAMPSVNFGAIDVTAGVNFSAAVSFSANCSGISGRKVRICPNFNAGTGGVNGTGSFRYLLSGANQMRFNIYSDNAYTTVWGSYTWGLAPAPPNFTIRLNGAGSGTGAFTARMRIPSGQNTLPGGVYTSSFSGSQTRVNYAYTTVGNCQTISNSNLNPTQAPFTVTAATGGICLVNATDINFGNQTFLSTNIDRTGIVSVRCPAGLAYSVGLDGGGAGPVAPDQRRLTNGADNISYGIYSDAARNAGWGNTIGVNTLSGTGNGSFQDFTAYARIPAQTTPAPNLYDDNIVVTITY